MSKVALNTTALKKMTVCVGAAKLYVPNATS